MFRYLAQMATELAQYRAQAEECQHTADLFPEDHMGQEFAELARRWRLIAEHSGSSSGWQRETPPRERESRCRPKHDQGIGPDRSCRFNRDRLFHRLFP